MANEDEIVKIGRYELREILGRGGFGVVYKGFDPNTGRTVAIKIANKDCINSTENLARFHQEARITAMLNHPGIVAIYDQGVEIALDINGTQVGSARPFIVMTLLPGPTLFKKMEALGTLPINEKLNFMIQVLDALEYAHSKGVVHRDMKPDNLIFGHDGKIKITDFGISKIPESNLTRSDNPPLGSKGYQSPEQIRGLPADKRSDIFACGIIFYQILTYEHPFGDIAAPSIDHKICNLPVEIPSKRNNECTPDLDRIILRSLEKDQNKRYQTASAFSMELERLIAEPRPEPPPQPTRFFPKKIKIIISISMSLGAVGLIWVSNLNKQFNLPDSNPSITAPSRASAAIDPLPKNGIITVSGIGAIDAKPGQNRIEALNQARLVAKQKMLEKVLALYLKDSSIQENMPLLASRFLNKPDEFIKGLSGEEASKTGLAIMQLRGEVKMHQVRSLINQIISQKLAGSLSRNDVDPKIGIETVVSGQGGSKAATGSPELEQIIKTQLQSLGFTSFQDNEAVSSSPANSLPSDFVVRMEIAIAVEKGLNPITETPFTIQRISSAKIKIIDKMANKEILSLNNPPGSKNGGSKEGVARLLVKSLSKDLFLQNIDYGVKEITLKIQDMDDPDIMKLLEMELNHMQSIVNVRLQENGKSFHVHVPSSNSSDIISRLFTQRLNERLGENCFALVNADDKQLAFKFSQGCKKDVLQAALIKMQTNMITSSK